MTAGFRTQGIAFGVCAMATVLASVLLPRVDHSTELVLVAVFTILLGVPHGAMDALFARRLCGTDTMARWIAFGIAYLAAACAVVVVWVVAPVVFLAGFLVVSAAHFSTDPRPGAMVVSRILYGGAIVVLPALVHDREVAGLFELLAGAEASAWIMPILAALALPWLVCSMAMAVIEARRDCVTGLELAALGVLAAVAPPLVAFGVFFCIMHSARHLLRIIAYASDLDPISLLAVAVAPMVIVFVASGACWLLLADQPVDARIMQILFVGLAALTVPHMILVERARQSGWAAPA